MSTAFRMILEGSQQSPVVATGASGLGIAIFDDAATTLFYEINVKGLDWGPFVSQAPETAGPLDNVNDAHFHAGARGVNGGVVLGWKNGDADDFTVSAVLTDGSRTVTGRWELTDAAGTPLSSFAAELTNAAIGSDVGLYANIHTNGNGGGEIRGQFVALSNDSGNMVDGTAEDDFLPALGGDDTLRGLAGDDRLDGGAGADIASFSDIGVRGNYDVRTYRAADGQLETRVEQVEGAGDGIDTLVNVETLQFYLDIVHLRGAQLNRMSNPDGDRFDDVLFQDVQTGQVIFAKMISGGFQGFDVVTSPLGTDFVAVASGNVNPSAGNGGSEVFVQSENSGTIYYASRDTGATTWGIVSEGLTANWKLRAVADVTRDASVDAIVQDVDTGQVLYADMRDGTFSGWGIVSLGLTADFVVGGAGDINRDGTADVVVQDTTSGDIFYAGMVDGAFQDFFLVTAALTPEWKAVAVADLNRDGFADVVVQNLEGDATTSPGTTFWANMADGEFSGWNVITTSVTGDWEVGGTADVDNDGHNDVLFQNNQSGTTVYAEMGPGGFEAFGAVTSTITSDFQLV